LQAEFTHFIFHISKWKKVILMGKLKEIMRSGLITRALLNRYANEIKDSGKKKLRVFLSGKEKYQTR
jgi:hypothetical protein